MDILDTRTCNQFDHLVKTNLSLMHSVVKVMPLDTITNYDLIKHECIKDPNTDALPNMRECAEQYHLSKNSHYPRSPLENKIYI